MSLYVRQSAWLSTAPEKPKGDKSDQPPLTRIEKLRAGRDDEDYQPDMPPIECGAYLIGYLFEVGPVMSGGMGPTAISHQEIAAWVGLTGIPLQPWEARLLRRLSREYVSEMHRAEKASAKAPWQPVDYVPDLSGVANDMRSRVRNLGQP